MKIRDFKVVVEVKHFRAVLMCRKHWNMWLFHAVDQEAHLLTLCIIMTMVTNGLKRRLRCEPPSRLLIVHNPSSYGFLALWSTLIVWNLLCLMFKSVNCDDPPSWLVSPHLPPRVFLPRPRHSHNVISVNLLTCKSLNQKAPAYISKLLKPYMPIRFLRSSEQTLSKELCVNVKTYGFRYFSVAAPKLWNSLPRSMRRPMSLESFKSKLKTHLMKAAHP